MRRASARHDPWKAEWVVVHSRALPMSFRGFLLVLVATPALALGASCVPVNITDNPGVLNEISAGGGGTVGSTGSGTPSTAGAGGGFSTSSGVVASMIMSSYQYLCGGSQPTCSPDPGSSDCTQGGNAGMGDVPLEPSDAAIPTCRLVNAGGVVAPACAMVGTGALGDPCAAATDCLPGLGCATTAPDVYTCRPYCCERLESCAKGTYCTTMGMAEAPKIDIPVCVQAMHCDLLSGAPCTGGQACAIVRDDGTTSCVTPGEGKTGEPCSCASGEPCACAAGYTCSWSDNTCLKLCQTMETGACGPNGICQGGVLQFPSGVGYCVE